MLDLIKSPNGVPVVTVAPTYYLSGAPTVPPMLINNYSTLTVPAYWRAMNFLADNLASFPRAVYLDAAKANPAPQPLSTILGRRPNRYQNPTQFWRTWFFHAAHFGNGYARIDREAFSGRPLAVHNILPDDTLPFRFDRDDGRGPMQFYYHRPTKEVLPGDDVLHLATLSYDGMAGLEPGAVHYDTMQRAGTLDRYATHYLASGTVIRGAIEIPGNITPDQRAEIHAELRRNFFGPDAERDVLVLSDGAKLNNSTLSPQESQLVQQGAQSTKQIAQITGVPPQFLYEFSESKYNNSIEAMGQDVVRYTFRPWIEQTEDELSLKMLSEAELDAGLTVRLNPDALLRGDTQTQTNTVATQVNAGIRTRNEARDLLGLPPSDDPDANKLKTLGDTAPQPATGAVTAPASNGNGRMATA